MELHIGVSGCDSSQQVLSCFSNYYSDYLWIVTCHITVTEEGSGMLIYFVADFMELVHSNNVR